jgi:hypothetical protein
MRKKVKDMITEDEIKEIVYDTISDVLEEKITNNSEEDLEVEDIARPTPHYLSEYGKFLVKSPITLSHLSIEQLKAIQRLMHLANLNLLDKKMISSFIHTYLKLKISVKKIGREDLKYLARYGSQRQETTIITKSKTREDYL